MLLSAGTVMSLGWKASQDPLLLRREFTLESLRVHAKKLRIKQQRSTFWAVGLHVRFKESFTGTQTRSAKKAISICFFLTLYFYQMCVLAKTNVCIGRANQLALSPLMTDFM